MNLDIDPNQMSDLMGQLGAGTDEKKDEKKDDIADGDKKKEDSSGAGQNPPGDSDKKQ